MKQKFPSILKQLKQKRWSPITQAVLIAMLSLFAVLGLNGIDIMQPATANPAYQVARGSAWQNASFPVENFQAYTSPFGYRRSPTGGYTEEFHSGLDIAAPMGSYVRNWWTGTVVEVIDDSRCGIGLVIQSGNWEHIYCHMDGSVETSNEVPYLIDRSGGILIGEGQQIPAGARIGRVGMTGRTTGPHLHWGLKYAGQWYDPALVIRQMYQDQQISRQP